MSVIERRRERGERSEGSRERVRICVVLPQVPESFVLPKNAHDLPVSKSAAVP